MNGRELLLQTIDGKRCERAPWVPFVGCHGGSLLGISAADYLKSSKHISDGLLKARELYRPDGLPVVFDLQIEAEILGCKLQWADDLPPCVASHPLEEEIDLAGLPSFSTDAGRFPLVFEAMDRLREAFAGEVALLGLITGPFTLAVHLRGNEIFLDMYDEPEQVKELITHCARIGREAAEAYLAHGADVIAAVDPMTSQISPEHFEEFVAPAVNLVFDGVAEKGGRSSLFVCGDARRVLEKMFQTNCHQVCVDENIPLPMARELARRHGKSFGGNLKLTTKLLLGTEADCRRDALECLEEGGSEAFVLAPGCDLPFAVPPANLAAVAEIVHDPYKREIERALAESEKNACCGVGPSPQAPEPDGEAVKYDGEDVVVEVVTLDSGACAPCQYMVNAARKAAEGFGGRVTVVEHKVKNHEGIGAMKRLGVANIPTICIDGQVRYVSLIPDQPALVGALQSALDAKAGAAT